MTKGVVGLIPLSIIILFEIYLLIFIKAQQKSGKFVIINFIRLILQLSLNIYFVMFLKTGVAGILYSSILSAILISTYLTYDTLKQVQIHFSMRKTKEIVKYGAPIIFSNVGAFILTFSDRYFLKYYARAKKEIYPLVK